MKLYLSFLIVIPLTVFSYTVSGNTLIPTHTILSSISFNPIKDIKKLYLKNGYPYVEVFLSGDKITIVEEKLTEINNASIPIRNSLISILKIYPKVISLRDIQNLSIFLYSINIPFEFKDVNSHIILNLQKYCNNIYFNGQLLRTTNLYLFLNKLSINCRRIMNVAWKGKDLYIQSTPIKLTVKSNFFHDYKILDCNDSLQREINIDKRNGWEIKRISSSSLNLRANIVNLDFTKLSLYFKYLYLNIYFNYQNLDDIKIEIGAIVPYIGFSIDNDSNFSIFLNDYNNIFCGILYNRFFILFNYNNFDIAYDKIPYIGFRYKNTSFLFGYNPKDEKFVFRIFDWRR